MKYIIAGRTGSGKDYLLNLLEQKGLSVVKSYTDRPKRNENDNMHTFIHTDQIEGIMGDQFCLYTVINGVHYFTTAEQIMQNDVLLLDYEPTKNVMEALSEVGFCIVYCMADDEVRRTNSMKRAAGNEALQKVNRERDASEYDDFTAFEEWLEGFLEDDTRDEYPDNMVGLHIVQNDYQPETMETVANWIIKSNKTFERLKCIVKEEADRGVLRTKYDQYVLFDTDDDSENWVPMDIAVSRLITSESLSTILLNWLGETDHLSFPSSGGTT